MFFFYKASILTVPLSKMNPRESAAFIASVSKDVEINPDGIRKIASEVLFLFTFVLYRQRDGCSTIVVVQKDHGLNIFSL